MSDPEDPRETTATEDNARAATNAALNSNYPESLSADEINALNNEVLDSEAVVGGAYDLIRASENDNALPLHVLTFSEQYIFTAYTADHSQNSNGSSIYIREINTGVDRFFYLGDVVDSLWEIQFVHHYGHHIIVKHNPSGYEEKVYRKNIYNDEADTEEDIEEDTDEYFNYEISQCGFPKGVLRKEIFTNTHMIHIYEDQRDDTGVIEVFKLDGVQVESYCRTRDYDGYVIKEGLDFLEDNLDIAEEEQENYVEFVTEREIIDHVKSILE